MNECKGMNCGATDGVSHSPECHAEHAATVAGGVFTKSTAQPVDAAPSVAPEPVAWRWKYKFRDIGETGAYEYHSHDFAVVAHLPKGEPLFAHPPRAPLTDEQIAAIVLSTVYEGDASTPYRDAWAAEIGVPFARAIEAVHGIRGQG